LEVSAHSWYDDYNSPQFHIERTTIVIKKNVLRILVVAFIALFTQVQPAAPALAASSSYVTFIPGYTPYVVGGGSLCSISAVDRISGLAITYSGGTAYLADFIDVPGYGTLVADPGYTDGGPAGSTSSWGFNVFTSFTVAPNTPIAVYTIAYSDASHSTPIYITKLVFNCTTAAVLSITSGPLGGTSVCSFTDGRLNKCDAGQTAAVYCLADGSIRVYAIFESKGYLAFTASPKEIDAVPLHPAQNTLIKQGNGARLYRLTGGELQLNRVAPDGQDHSFTFSDCPRP